MTINFDFSGAEIFLSHLRGQIEIGRVLEHPAYQTVARHAQMFGMGICTQDVMNALNDRPSPFYGLDGLSENLSRILSLLEFLHQHATDWGPPSKPNCRIYCQMKIWTLPFTPSSATI
jgi:hypothetical protein